MARKKKIFTVHLVNGAFHTTTPGAYNTIEDVEREISSRNPLKCTRNLTPFSVARLRDAAVELLKDRWGDDETFSLDEDFDNEHLNDLRYHTRELRPEREKDYVIKVSPEFVIAIGESSA